MALSDILKDLDISGGDLVKLGGKAVAAGALARQKQKSMNELASQQAKFAQENLNKFGGLSKSIEQDLMSGKYDSDALAKATSDQISTAETNRANQLQNIAKTQGDLVSALRTGDSRALALAPGMIGANQAAIQAADAEAAKVKSIANLNFAEADQAQKDKQRQLATNLFDTYKGLELGAGQDVQQAELDLAAARAQAPMDALSNFASFNPQANFGEKGMKYMGEEGFVTEGEFDHDTNKKAVVDEESGEKEAELTGGEFVFNPRQTSRIEKLVEADDAKALLSFMRNLLSKPQFRQ